MNEIESEKLSFSSRNWKNDSRWPLIWTLKIFLADLKRRQNYKGNWHWMDALYSWKCVNKPIKLLLLVPACLSTINMTNSRPHAFNQLLTGFCYDLTRVTLVWKDTNIDFNCQIGHCLLKIVWIWLIDKMFGPHWSELWMRWHYLYGYISCMIQRPHTIFGMTNSVSQKCTIFQKPLVIFRVTLFVI